MEFDFKLAYDYACNASIDELFQRSIIYNAFISQLYYYDSRGTVGHDVILTLISSIFGPFETLSDEKIVVIKEYLEYIDRGFENWGSKTDEWFSYKIKDREDMIYFSKLSKVLMEKSDSIYRLLCLNKDISVYELMKDSFNYLKDHVKEESNQIDYDEIKEEDQVEYDEMEEEAQAMKDEFAYGEGYNSYAEYEEAEVERMREESYINYGIYQ